MLKKDMAHTHRSTTPANDPINWRAVLVGVFALLFLFTAYALRKPLDIDLLQNVEHELFPCERPITYTLHTFDDEFGISQEEFLNAVTAAEQQWEDAIDRELFTRVEKGGSVTLNLIYDHRQEATEQLQELNISMESTRENYDALHARYNTAYADYQREKAELDKQMNTYNQQLATYEKKVEDANAAGGASPRQYRALRAEQNRLNQEAQAINAQVEVVNELANTVNALAVALNDLAGQLNLAAEHYNMIGAELGPEFVEGTYGAGVEGNEINIYQFENLDKLERVLTHEFGHALGLDHVEDPQAIMYRLNLGTGTTLTESDITELKAVCRIK